jgi:hypothetical protein
MQIRNPVHPPCDIYWCVLGCDSTLPRRHQRSWPSGLNLVVQQNQPGQGSPNGMQPPSQFILVEQVASGLDQAAKAQADADYAEARRICRWCSEWQPSPPGLSAPEVAGRRDDDRP